MKKLQVIVEEDVAVNVFSPHLHVIVMDFLMEDHNSNIILLLIKIII